MEATRMSPMTDLLRATEGVRNVKALVLLIAGFVLAAAIFSLGMATRSVPGTLLTALLAALCAGVAYSAAGVVLMAAAQQTEAPGWSDAVLAGAFAYAKMIVVALIAFVAALLYWLILAAVFYLCKIPVLGPLLYAVALPVAVIATAVAAVCAYVAFSLLFPALWQGQTVRGAIAQLLAVAGRRAGEVLLRLLLLSLVIGVVVGILFFFLGGATLSVTALSAGVIGGGNTLSALGGMPGMGGHGAMGMLGMAGAGGGHMIAGMFGLGVVWAIAAAACLSVFQLGINLIYLSAVEGIDASQTESMLAERLEQARRKANELKEQAAQAAQDMQARARQAQERVQQATAARAAEQAAAAAAAAQTPSAPSCPACHAPVSAADAFCGECGCKLR